MSDKLDWRLADFLDEFFQRLGVEPSSAAIIATIARRIPESERRIDLSGAHYALIASFTVPADLRRGLIKHVADEEMDLGTLEGFLVASGFERYPLLPDVRMISFWI